MTLVLALPASLAAEQRDLSLIEAIQRRDHGTFSALLRGKADVNATQPDGATALAWAVHLGEHRMANALLTAGARVNTADEYGETPLTLAAANGDAVLVQRLLDAGAKADVARWNGETALMVAAGAGNIAVVRALAFQGANVNASEPRRGQTALMWAAAEGHADIVAALLEIGADAKAVSRSGFNALAFAVAKNDAVSVRHLLAAGLDANFVLPSGNNVLLMAMGYRHSASALALIDGGADVQATDRGGNAPLHIAAQVGDEELVSKLLARSADANVRTPKAIAVRPGRDGGGTRITVGGSMTPLMIAARNNHVNVMRLLMAAGADPSVESDNGTTVTMLAAGAKLDTVKYAFEIDPRVAVANQLGQTPMHAAVGSGVQRTQDEICEVVQFLADRGAALDEVDAAGRTPITIADVAPIDKAVELLTALIHKSGKTPRIPSKR